MQLARSLFLTRERTWRRKIEEALLAVELEKTYSKQQILTLYLNLLNLGHGNYGVEAASRYYFSKPARGADRSPRRRRSPASSRRPAATARTTHARPGPPPARPRPAPDARGGLHHPRPVRARRWPSRSLVVTQRPQEHDAPYFAEDVRKYLEATYGATDLYEAGLQVYGRRSTRRSRRRPSRRCATGLLRLDHQRGLRGPIATLGGADLETSELPTWGRGRRRQPGRWLQGLVLESGARGPGQDRRRASTPSTARASPGRAASSPADLLKPGDVAWFRLAVRRTPKNAKAASARRTARRRRS